MNYQQDAAEANIKELAHSINTVVVTKKSNNTINLSNTWKYAEGIQEYDPVDHE